jgi:hypothetical protein
MATASAGRATRVRRRLPRVRAPLQPDGLAVCGRGRGENKPPPDRPAPALKREEWI